MKHAKPGSKVIDPNLMSIIIPSHNEEAYIGACLDALLAQQGHTGPVEVILMANACTDGTVPTALSFKRAFSDRGWKLRVLRTVIPGKAKALNCADKVVSGAQRVYLDADVVCGPNMIAQLHTALNAPNPVYATGKLCVAPAKTWITRRYATLWTKLPFMRSKAPGAGLFAVNQAGRARWDVFPDIISDDTFVRLQFTDAERQQVAESYQWPMVEGFANLVKVRQRQDEGVREIDQYYPGLRDREAKPKASYVALFLGNPVSFTCYVLVSIAVRATKRDKYWARGR